jgi:hypothetical protein
LLVQTVLCISLDDNDSKDFNAITMQVPNDLQTQKSPNVEEIIFLLKSRQDSRLSFYKLKFQQITNKGLVTNKTGCEGYMSCPCSSTFQVVEVLFICLFFSYRFTFLCGSGIHKKA